MMSWNIRPIHRYKLSFETLIKFYNRNEDKYHCTEDVMRSSRTFSYEVYEGEMIVEEDGEAIYKDFCYTSDYYYTD